ncbi:hypothetical protein HYH03_013325 [Edaphochlamys debaryana]|uniref:Uncharacterized protein n=1 Tax=Edaphochlamys debaryana TaxID=47281 RepID=A0A836BUQ2_9CHLO|nr:hypothetical protein HYH03_013325 [Edaphochlamys debaryana]|eukprot:KAG2488184.1 hypothetical protein HYH03_013325 [Edaphochlamys debaryana]
MGTEKRSAVKTTLEAVSLPHPLPLSGGASPRLRCPGHSRMPGLAAARLPAPRKAVVALPAGRLPDIKDERIELACVTDVAAPACSLPCVQPLESDRGQA